MLMTGGVRVWLVLLLTTTRPVKVSEMYRQAMVFSRAQNLCLHVLIHLVTENLFKLHLYL